MINDKKINNINEINEIWEFFFSKSEKYKIQNPNSRVELSIHTEYDVILSGCCSGIRGGGSYDNTIEQCGESCDTLYVRAERRVE